MCGAGQRPKKLVCFTHIAPFARMRSSSSHVMESRLIECIRDNPCLWNPEIEEYKLNVVKDAAWREVVKECDISDVKEAKCVWKKLRDGYRQATRKRNGKSPNPNIVWKYEKQMEFLLPTMKNRPPRFANVEWLKEENRYVDESNHIEDSSESAEQQSEESFYIPPKRATLSKEKEQKLDPDRTQVSPKTPKDNALENFFTSMFLTTRELPERLQLRVQRQIFNSVLEAKEESLASQPSCWAASSSAAGEM